FPANPELPGAKDFVIFNEPVFRVMVLFTVTSTVVGLDAVTVTMPSLAVPELSVYVATPKVQPLGAVGSAGSVTVHTVPVGMPLIVVTPPAARVAVPSWAVPSLH